MFEVIKIERTDKPQKEHQKIGPGWPDGEDDVINKWGTYEVQATCGMENEFPMIAQGISREEAQRRKRKRP